MRCGGGGVEEGVVGGEVMSVVDARKVVEEGVLDEGEAVEGVHGPVERGESERGSDC